MFGFVESDGFAAPKQARSDRDVVEPWARRLLTVVLLGALLSPVIRNEDSLPLSTYPMFAGTRSSLSSFITASGVDESGDRLALSALTISQSRDRLIAQAFLNDAVQRGDEAAICAEIAGRSDGSAVSVEIAREQHDTIARLRGEASLQKREVLASCEVRR